MIALLLTLTAAAQTAPVTSYGEIRYIGSQMSDFNVDAEGQMSGQGLWLDQRFRIGTVGTLPGVLTGTVEFDLLTGQLLGDVWDIPGTVDEQGRGVHDALTADGMTPRRISAETYVGNYQIELGLVSSSWGLGMLANDGAVDPLFGRADFGDRSVRLRATHIPSGDGPPARTTVLTTGALDYGIDDDFARIADGQQVGQAIFSMLALGRRGKKVGTYMVIRQQFEAQEGRQTQAFVVDGYGDLPWEFEGGWTLRTAVEAAAILGRTNRATTYNAREWVGITSLGVAGICTLAPPDEHLKAHLFGGFASGDGRPDDGFTRDFTFDRDFGVGMVLFDQVMGGIDANAYTLLTDPGIAGQPPDGVDALVTEGAFLTAAYIQPAIEVSPHDWVSLKTGVLLAASTAPYMHPFYSYRGGGTPHNQHNQPSRGRHLGTEIDWGVGVMMPEEPDQEQTKLRAGMGLQGGHAFLGAALRADKSRPISLLTATARAVW